MANKRLKKYLSEEDRIRAKIAELQGHLEDVKVARGQEEEAAIVKTIRGMKLKPHELAELLDGIQSGEITLLRSDNFLDEDDGSTDVPDENTLGALDEDAPESEDDYGGQTTI